MYQNPSQESLQEAFSWVRSLQHPPSRHEAAMSAFHEQLQDFPRFQQLPENVRVKIWRELFPAPRTISLFAYNTDGTRNYRSNDPNDFSENEPYEGLPQPPIGLQINQESRRETLKRYHLFVQPSFSKYEARLEETEELLTIDPVDRNYQTSDLTVLEGDLAKQFQVAKNMHRAYDAFLETLDTNKYSQEARLQSLINGGELSAAQQSLKSDLALGPTVEAGHFPHIFADNYGPNIIIKQARGEFNESLQVMFVNPNRDQIWVDFRCMIGHQKSFRQLNLIYMLNKRLFDGIRNLEVHGVNPWRKRLYGGAVSNWWANPPRQSLGSLDLLEKKNGGLLRLLNNLQQLHLVFKYTSPMYGEELDYYEITPAHIPEASKALYKVLNGKFRGWNKEEPSRSIPEIFYHEWRPIQYRSNDGYQLDGIMRYPHNNLFPKSVAERAARAEAEWKAAEAAMAEKDGEENAEFEKIEQDLGAGEVQDIKELLQASGHISELELEREREEHQDEYSDRMTFSKTEENEEQEDNEGYVGSEENENFSIFTENDEPDLSLFYWAE